MAIVSYREYARQKGVSLEAIRKRIKAGSITPRAIVRLPGVKWPKIDTEIADQDFEMLRDENNQMGWLMREKIRPSQPTPPETVIEETVDPIDEMFGPSPKDDVVRQKSILDKKVAPIDKPKTVVKEVNGQKVEVHVEPSIAPETQVYFDKYRKAKAGTEELKARKLELEVAAQEGLLLDKEDARRTIEKMVALTREKILNLPSKIAPELLAIKNLIELENVLIAHINQALEDLQKIGAKFE